MSQPTRHTALIVMDVQQGFDDPSWGTRNNPDAETNIARLLEAWRGAGRPVFFARHDSRWPTSPLRPGQPGNRIKDAVAPRPGEPVLPKTVNSAFIGTPLEAELRRLGVTDVVITGLVTNHCVSTTARMAANLGFRTVVVADGTATFDRTGPDGRHWSAEDMHAMELAALNGEFAAIATTEELLAGLGFAVSA
jgi:nicotinamidase-related amidase